MVHYNTLWGDHCFPAIARRCRTAATAAAVGTYLVLHRHGVCVLCVVVCTLVVADAAGTPHSRPLAVASGLQAALQCGVAKMPKPPVGDFAIFAFRHFRGNWRVSVRCKGYTESSGYSICIVLYCSSLVS